MVDEGTFREDLLARIAQEVVRLPPLRERREEIPHLIALDLKKKVIRAEPEFIEACLLHDWPRNVRELRSVVQSAARRAGIGGSVTIDDLRAEYRVGRTVDEVPPQPTQAELDGQDDDEVVAEPNAPWWPDVKRIFLETGNATKAAQLAGAPVSTAARWIKRVGLVPQKHSRRTRRAPVLDYRARYPPAPEVADVRRGWRSPRGLVRNGGRSSQRMPQPRPSDGASPGSPTGVRRFARS
jgi:DNA-binding NtrC family response regulator